MKKISPILIFLTVISCGNNETLKNDKENQSSESIELILPLESPAEIGSSVPNLFTNEAGEVYMTWTESQEENISILYFSTLEGDKWSVPIEIANGNNWVVNWADFSSMTKFGDNLVANILLETDPETFAYDVNLIISNDNGNSWGEPFLAHSDGTKTEHGFVSLVPFGKDQFMAIWLDGRKYDSGEDEMTLRAGIFTAAGEVLEEFVLDERVCDCCGTNAIITSEGIVVIYRNRDENELRDMSMVYFSDGKWSKPSLVSEDKWEIPGCPVNGPAIDAIDSKMSVAWFTAANGIPMVKFTYSESVKDGFTDGIIINENPPIGRVDVCVIDKNTSVVSWMEEDSLATYLKIRTVKTDGTMQLGQSEIITEMNGGRSSGFPKMIKMGEQLLIVWTNVADEKSIETVLINLSEME